MIQYVSALLKICEFASNQGHEPRYDRAFAIVGVKIVAEMAIRESPPPHFRGGGVTSLMGRKARGLFSHVCARICTAMYLSSITAFSRPRSICGTETIEVAPESPSIEPLEVG
jgi:hypothetical protein